MRGEKHASLHALGKMTRARVVNGPELNILLLGIPFLIDFGVSYGSGNFKKPGGTRGNAGAAKPPVRVKFKQQQGGAGPAPANTGDAGIVKPLPTAPFTDHALGMYKEFLRAGMSEEGARQLATGELEGEEVADHLSEGDLRVFIELFGSRLDVDPGDVPAGQAGL